MRDWTPPDKQERRRPAADESTTSPVAAVSVQLADAGLIAIIFVAPLFFGGRHMLGRLVFVTLACMTGVAWFTRQAAVGYSRSTRTWAYVAWGAAILLVAAQLIPLPTSWLEWLAPRNLSLLALWTDEADGGVHLGSWNTLSLTPSATKLALATLIAYALLFATVHQRLESLGDIHRLLKLIAISAIFMSCFGLLQYFLSNGRFFWFYEYPYSSTSRDVKGSFSCRNHFAHFVALGMAPLFAWIALNGKSLSVKKNRSANLRSLPRRSETTVASFILLAGLLVTLLAVLLSFSRGGAIAVATVVAVVLTIYYRRQVIPGSYLYSMAAVGLLILGALSVNGYNQVADRLDDFVASVASGSLDELDSREGRRKIWGANLASIEAGGLFGSGAGSHRDIYPVYLPESLPIEYTHAENGPLQVATENGWLGLGLLVFAMGLVGSWCWRAVRRAPSDEHVVAAGAVSAGLAACVVHSFVDFVWFVPACMSLAIMLAACALRLKELSTIEPTSPRQVAAWRRPQWIGFASLAAAGATWAVSTAMGPGTAALHWDRYLLVSSSGKKNVARQIAKFKPDPNLERDQLASTETMIFNLQNVVSHDPTSACAHRRLAREYLKLFELRQSRAANAMSVNQIRDAAISSQFASGDQLRQWLDRAFGENSTLLFQAYQHTRRALQLSPLQGECYLYLAQLCFLEGRGVPQVDAYLEQCERVRPHDGDVLFRIGWQQFHLGRAERAIEYWREAYRGPGNSRLKIVRLLAGQLPSAEFVAIFQPDWSSLPQIWKAYRHVGRPEDLRSLLKFATSQARNDAPDLPSPRAAAIWLALAEMQRELDDADGAAGSLRQAYAVAPSNYKVRRAVALHCQRIGRFENAAVHLRWCLARRPDDRKLQDKLIAATKQRLTQTPITVTNNEFRQ